MKTKAAIENSFKETEIGLIPEDWQVKEFEECIGKERISRDIKIPQGKYKKVGRYPIVDQGANFIAGYTDDKSKLYSGCLPVIVFGDHTRIFKFINFSFSLGADGTKLIQPKDFLNPKYFYYYLCSLTIESKGYNRHYKYLKEKIIAFPEKPEQQKISFILSKIQQAIEQQEKIIETTRELKKSLMNKLFTEGLHSEEQKETEIGLMPKSWRIVKLGDNDIVEVIMGQSPPSSTYNTMKEGIPFFQGKAEFGDIYPKAKKYCSKPNRIANEGDILLSVRAPVGDVNLSSFICCIGRGLAAIRCKDKLNNYFLFNYLLQSKSKIASLGDGSTFKAIGKTVVKNIRFPLPERKKQDEITNIFSNIDKKLSQAESKKQTLQALFRTMLNQLMTGKVRVKDLDFEVKENV